MNVNYSFKRLPLKHQLKEFLHHIRLPRSATFSETGSGKTFPILAATEFRFQNNLIDSCLYVAPNSLLEKIDDEVKIGTNLESLILHSPIRKKRISLIETKSDIHIINYEALQYYLEYLLDNNYDQLIFDEAHNLRDHLSNTSKAAKQLSKKSKFCILATGTPICSEPEDMFGLYKVLDINIFGRAIGKFRDKFCERVITKISGYKKSIEFPKTIGFKPGTEKEFRLLVDSVSISHKKEDCLDLPPKIEETRYLDLESKSKQVYSRLKSGKLEDIGETNFSMDSGGVKCLRASQICSGFLYYYEAGKRKSFDICQSSKIREMKSILDSRQDMKTVVWCRFAESIRRVCSEFSHLNPEYQTSNHDNNKSRKIFQTDPNCKLIVNQLSISDGYELTSSDCAIYFELPYEYHRLKQSQDRIHRKGSEMHDQIMYYYLVTRGTVEESILKILTRKQNLHDVATGDIDKIISGKYS